MLKIYDLLNRARAEGGETVLGRDDLETHACYLVFGCLEPGQHGRVLKPGHGHEEIICLAAGQAVLVGPDGRWELKPGQAFHLVGDVTYTLENPGPEPALYLAAGGHSGHHHHHH
ncbi:MAG: cupin domain-containing protein [Desulfobacteraceae bacterium]